MPPLVEPGAAPTNISMKKVTSMAPLQAPPSPSIHASSAGTGMISERSSSEQAAEQENRSERDVLNRSMMRTRHAARLVPAPGRVRKGAWGRRAALTLHSEASLGARGDRGIGVHEISTASHATRWSPEAGIARPPARWEEPAAR